jgi:hypothetical protein
VPGRYLLIARIRSADLAAVQRALAEFVGPTAKVVPTRDGVEVTTELQGASARDLNRQLLSRLRRVEKRTTLRAEWTHEAITERFFDYVPKGTRPATEGSPPRS